MQSFRSRQTLSFKWNKTTESTACNSVKACRCSRETAFDSAMHEDSCQKRQAMSALTCIVLASTILDCILIKDLSMYCGLVTKVRVVLSTRHCFCSLSKSNARTAVLRMRDSSMWRSSDQEALGLDRSFLQQQQQQQTPRNSHDTLFHRQHQTSQPQLSEQHPGEFMRAQTAGQANNNIAHGLPQALLAEAGHAADLPNMQLDLDSVTLSAALGLGGDNALAQFQRNLSDQNGQSSSDLSAILAASLGLPVQSALLGTSRLDANTRHALWFTGSNVSWHLAWQRGLDGPLRGHWHV